MTNLKSRRSSPPRPLKLLNNPAQNGAKYFPTAAVLETAKDRTWLVKSTPLVITGKGRTRKKVRPDLPLAMCS
jgi:hypothetical protein